MSIRRHRPINFKLSKLNSDLDGQNTYDLTGIASWNVNDGSMQTTYANLGGYWGLTGDATSNYAGLYIYNMNEVGLYDSLASPTSPPAASDLYSAFYTIYDVNDAQLGAWGFNSGDMELYNSIRGGILQIYARKTGGTYSTIELDPDNDLVELQNSLDLRVTGSINGAPASRSISASGNTATTDYSMLIALTGGSAQTLTLDGDPPTDAFVLIDNRSGNSWTIAASTSLIWAKDATTGNRTLADDGIAVAIHRGSGTWIINGSDLLT